MNMNTLFQCRNDSKKLFYNGGGAFYGDNPFTRVLPFNMVRLGLFFVISSTLHRYLKPFKQTEYVCNVVAAIILGPSVLGRFSGYKKMIEDPTQAHFISFAGYVGVLYYLFITCVKIDCETLMRTKRKSWVIGLSSIVAPALVMGILTNFVHRLPLIKYHAYLFDMQLSCTSFTNISSMLEELDLLTTEIGQTLMSVGLTNEVVMWGFWISMMVRTNLAYGKRSFSDLVFQFLVIVVTIIVFRLTMKFITRRMYTGQTVKEAHLSGILLVVLVMSCITDLLGGSTIVGVISVGLAIPSGPPLGASIIGRCEAFIKYCIFPFFYLGVGDMIDIHHNFKDSDDRAHFTHEGILIAGYVTKVATTMLGAMSYNMTAVQGLTLGFGMNMSGVMHIAVYWGFWLRKLLLKDVTTHLVLNSMVVSSIVSPLVYQLHRRYYNMDHMGPGFELSIQAASMGSKINILACLDSEEQVPVIISLFNLSGLAESDNFRGYMVHLTQLDGQATPMVIPHRKHQRICAHNGCVQIASAIETFYDKFKSSFSVQLLTIVAPFNNIHESVSKLAQDKLIPLVIIPFLYKDRCHLTKRLISDVFDQKLQGRAPCSVGIIVDKGLTNYGTSKSQELSSFSGSIVVIFFGGEDDRESLAYAIWMSRHQDVGITLVRIVVQDYYRMDDEGEKILDEYWVQSFTNLMNDTNSKILIFREIQAEEWLQAIDIVQSLDNVYDLVMVGRRHGVARTVLEEQQICVLADFPELGDIGELLVTNNFQWKCISVLVIQHCVSNVL